MRHVIQRRDGQFVRFQVIPGVNPPRSYMVATSDAADAHDFGSAAAASAWIRANDFDGEAHELTDSGYWPME